MRTIAITALFAVLLAPCAVRAAGTYPDKPIRFVIPFPPGGNTDVLGRLLAQRVSQTIGQQLVIDNRPGAGGTVGVGLVTRATPDGYTIVMGTFASVLVANSLYKHLDYNPQRDLSPVVLVSEPPGLLVVNASSPVRTVRDLIARARAHPGALNYASSGAGTWNNLFSELFNSMAHVKIVQVPYRGASPAVTGLLTGETQMMFAPFPPALPQVRSGKLRAIAVSTLKRSALLPDVPTVAESGVPGYSAAGWFAVMAPAKTPASVIRLLNRQFNMALQSAGVKKSLALDGAEPAGGTVRELAQSIREGSAKWGKLIRRLNIHL